MLTNQGMKEYNVDLVMMNGGDIRGLHGVELGAPQLSHAKKNSGPVLVGFFGDLLGMKSYPVVWGL